MKLTNVSEEEGANWKMRDSPLQIRASMSLEQKHWKSEKALKNQIEKQVKNYLKTVPSNRTKSASKRKKKTTWKNEKKVLKGKSVDIDAT